MVSDDQMNTFAAWVGRALTKASSFRVAAYNFNLYEDVASWDFELVGTSRFDIDDQEWACDSIYSHPELCRYRRQHVGEEREQALAFAIELVSTYLRSGAKKEMLRSSEGIGVGFVNGDLSILWPEFAA